MQLKRYEARTIQEAVKMIKTDLGDDAVIFSSRTIQPKSKSTKKSSSQWVEVVAAVDRNGSKRLQKEPDNSMINAVLSDAYKNKEKSLMIEDNNFVNPYKDICKNWDSKGSVLLNTAFLPYLKNLFWSGFNQEFAWYLIGEATAEYNKENNYNSMDDILLQKIACHIPIKGPITLDPDKSKAVALIGPTGVGKTTTLAKIAAHYSIHKRFKVKIVTMDTYRIAAVEQLKIYGKIMGIPVNVASTIRELEKELEVQDDVNLILIDTAGRNHRDNGQIHELSQWLQKYKEIESHLLISATTSEEILRSIIQYFNKSKADRIIITKVDESIKLGHIYHILVSANIPISYITTGQKVPEDIKPASEKTLSNIFLKGFNN